MEVQFVAADWHRLASDQGRVGAAVVIGFGSGDCAAGSVIRQFKQVDFEAAGRNSVAGVEDVGRQPAVDLQPVGRLDMLVEAKGRYAEDFAQCSVFLGFCIVFEP